MVIWRLELMHLFFFFSFPPQFCHNDKKTQKYLLGGIECLVKLHQSQLLPRVPIILKDLYDADLLEEDVILAWAEKVQTHISDGTLLVFNFKPLCTVTKLVLILIVPGLQKVCL